MIHSFSCKNFYSFQDLTTVDFVVNDNAPNNNGYFKTPTGTRLSKVETVIGPNASGKTNLLKVLPFLKWLIVDSFERKPEAEIIVQPFLFGSGKEDPVELSVTFEVNGNIYIYAFILNKNKILSEVLKIKSKTKEKNTLKKIFSRTWDNSSNRYLFQGDSFDLPKGFENTLRANASVIGSAVRLNHKESKDIAKFWQQIETNVVEAGWVGGHLFPNRKQQLFEAFGFYNDNQVLKAEAEKLLSRFDIGLGEFTVKKEQKEEGTILNVTVSHSFNGQSKFLPIQYESSGTMQLFILLKSILKVLANGGVAILDEFDVNLHPEMVAALFDLFVQPETNMKNAQLLFSAHSHLILNKLDKYQIIFVEKNKSGASESWRLDEVTGVRADDNYYTKYLAGAYGAVPKL